MVISNYNIFAHNFALKNVDKGKQQELLKKNRIILKYLETIFEVNCLWAQNDW